MTKAENKRKKIRLFAFCSFSVEVSKKWRKNHLLRNEILDGLVNITALHTPSILDRIVGSIAIREGQQLIRLQDVRFHIGSKLKMNNESVESQPGTSNSRDTYEHSRFWEEVQIAFLSQNCRWIASVRPFGSRTHTAQRKTNKNQDFHFDWGKRLPKKFQQICHWSTRSTDSIALADGLFNRNEIKANGKPTKVFVRECVTDALMRSANNSVEFHRFGAKESNGCVDGTQWQSRARWVQHGLSCSHLFAAMLFSTKLALLESTMVCLRLTNPFLWIDCRVQF